MSDLSCRCKECRPDLWPKNEDGSVPVSPTRRRDRDFREWLEAQPPEQRPQVGWPTQTEFTGTYDPDPTRTNWLRDQPRPYDYEAHRAEWEAYLRSGQDEYRTRARMEGEVERQLAARQPEQQRETLADILQRLARRITNGDDGRD